MKLNINILLCCDLPVKVEEALMEFDVNFIKESDFDNTDEKKKISFAIIDDVGSLEYLNTKYDFVENHIRVISLSPVENFNDFMSYNGRAVLDESWFDSKLGLIFAHKILSESGSVHLNKNFNSLVAQVGTAKIGSHMKMGYYSDMIALDAFEHNFNVVGMRGFFDSITYYLTYLKQAGISTYPLHLEYANAENLFFVQISASVRDFIGEYINASVGLEDPFDPYKHLLRSAAFLTDYLDVTYIEQNEKLVFTGIWENLDKKKKKSRVQSFAFNNIFSAKQQQLVINDRIEVLKSSVSDEKIRTEKTLEKLEEKALPGGPAALEREDEPEFINVDGHGELNIGDMLEHIIGNAESDNPYVQLEGMTEDNMKVYLNGFGDDPDFAQKISGENIESILQKIQGYNIKKASESNLDKTRDELKDDLEYKTFVRKSLEENIKELSEKNLSAEEVTEIVTSTIEETSDDEFQIVKGSKSEKEAGKQQLIEKRSAKLDPSEAHKVGVDSLQKLWGIEKKYVVKKSQEKINDRKEDSMSVKSLGQEGLLQQLKQKDDLIQNMKSKLKTLMAQLKNVKESNKISEEVTKIASEEIMSSVPGAQVDESNLEQDQHESNNSSQDLGSLQEGQALSAQQSEEIKNLLSRQLELVKRAKNFQLEAKKREIELRSQKLVYDKQILGLNGKIKTLDIDLEKTKSGIQTLSERKDKQIEAQNNRMHSLNAMVSKLKASNNDAIIKKLEKEKISIHRQLDKFKKLSEEAMLRLRNAEKHNRTSALEVELKSQKKTSELLQSKIERSDKDKLLAIQKFNEMKKFNVQLKTKYDEQVQLVAAKDKEIKQIQAELAKKPTEVIKTVEVKAEAAEIEQSDISPIELQHIIDQKDAKIKDLLEQLENIPEPAVAEAPKVETAQAEITKLELKQLNTKLHRLEDERSKSIEDMRGANKAVSDAQRDIKKKDMEIKALDAKYKNLERQFELYKQKNNGRKAS